MMMSVDGARVPLCSDMSGIEVAGTYSVTDGSIATLQELIARLQKIGGEMRDMERAFGGAMQRVLFDKQLLALDTKRKAIDETFSASMASSIAQAVGGAVSMFGAGSGSQIGTSAADGLSKAGQGIAGVASAGMTRDAQESQLLGEFQTQVADQVDKSLATTINRAREASEQMRASTQALTTLHGQLTSAVRI